MDNDHAEIDWAEFRAVSNPQPGHIRMLIIEVEALRERVKVAELKQDYYRDKANVLKTHVVNLKERANVAETRVAELEAQVAYCKANHGSTLQPWP